MDLKTLPGFGEIKKELKFDGFWDWFVTYNDVHTLWKAQPTHFIVSTLFLVGGLVTFYHALKSGGRFVHLWIGIICHGLVVETVSYNLPDIDSFWHSQTPIIFLGRRLPLHIIVVLWKRLSKQLCDLETLHPENSISTNPGWLSTTSDVAANVVFIYTAAISVDKLRLTTWSEPFAVGLIVDLIDYPYDLMAVKFVHWTWHDTDPNIFDRHYHIPWNSFYFHATFAAAFIFWFHSIRRFLIPSKDRWTSGSFLKESLCTLIASLLGMPTGVLLFIPNYHLLHDIYNLHSEITFYLLLATFVVLTLSGLFSLKILPQHARCFKDYLLLAYLAIYYLIFFGMALIGDPSSEVSIGLHEPIGPCEEKAAIKTAFGQTLYKRKYLCVNDYDESYFNFSCLSEGKPSGKIGEYYTICGTPFENRVEYIILMLIITILAVGVFLNIFLRTTVNKNTHKKKN